MENLEVAALGDRKIKVSRRFDGPPEAVFNALTDREAVQRWMVGERTHTMVECQIDFVEGGKYRYVWELGDGRKIGCSGEFIEISRPSRLVCTELFDEDWTGGEIRHETSLTEEDGKTRLEVVMEYSSKEARDRVLESQMKYGMEGAYANLDSFLREGAAQ